MPTLLKPLRTFFDTNHLVNILHVRQGGTLRGGQSTERVEAYRTTSTWLNTGRLVPLFYEPMSYEWIWQKVKDGARRIAQIFDDAISTKVVLPDHVLFVAEVLNECRRLRPERSLPGPFDVVGDIGFDDPVVAALTRYAVRDDEKPGVVGVVLRSDNKPTIRMVVDAVRSQVGGADELRQIAIDGALHALEQTRQTQRRHPGLTRPTTAMRRLWLSTALEIDQMLVKACPDIDTDTILNEINLDACPALQVRLDAFWNYARATHSPRRGDLVDLTVFAALPYADVALIENRMHEFVRQVRPQWTGSRVFRDPVEFVRALKF